MNWVPEDLIAFEKEIESIYLEGKIRGPVHFSGGNEETLIKIFGQVNPEDWVLSTHRSHYHALLHGVPRELVKAEILAGRSIDLHFKEYRFLTSAIVGGCLPITVGIAMGIKRNAGRERVWCFVGDMASTTGIFHECSQYAARQRLPISFVVEDNGLSVNTPTDEAWGPLTKETWWDYDGKPHILRYNYTRIWPHLGCGKWITFA